MKNKTLMKTLSAFLAVVMVICSAPLSGFVGLKFPEIKLPGLFDFGVEAEAYYTENGFRYEVTNGEATLIGCIETGDIVIPSTLGGYPVKSIGKAAFHEHHDITSVTIPNSITSIGDQAFERCTRLTSVTIPDSVTSVGNYVFWDCTSLFAITLGDNITSIGNMMFSNCTSLVSIAVPNGVTSIGYEAFYNCTSLTSVTIGNGVTSIGEDAFYSCTNLASVTIGNSVTSIYSGAFSNCTSLARVYYTGDIESWCNISFDGIVANPMYYAKNFYIDNILVKEIVIPDTVTEIKDYAFYSFEGITSVTIPDSITSIGDYSFKDCTSLALVTIGNGVTSIGNHAFWNCTSLLSITTPDSVTSIGDYAFSDCTSLISVTIGNGVTSIGDYAFYDCDSLASITIPDSVISIGTWAFWFCWNLTDVYYTGDVESWCNISFSDSYATPMCCAKNFYLNGRLLENLVVSQGATTIKSVVFYGFECVKSVTIPESVITIREDAFSGCNNIQTVTYGGSESQWEEIAIYDGNDYLKNAKKVFLDGVHEHVYSSSITTESTCTETGIKTFICRCDDTYTEVIPALGHTWGDWVVAKEPTTIDDGLKVRMCKVCTEAVECLEIPAVGITITLTDLNGNVISKIVVEGDVTEYSFTELEDGEYTVTVSKANYVTREYDVVSSDGKVTVEFKLNLLGDIDGNGKVNISDYNAILRHVKKTSALDGYAFDCADIDGNGKIMVTDYNAVLRHVKKTEMLW